jgi:hypothetical protein
MSLTVLVGTYAITLECNTYVLKYLSALTITQSRFYKVSYFNSASLRLLLKKEIGCSNPSLFFCKSVATIICSHAKENIKC